MIHDAPQVKGVGNDSIEQMACQDRQPSDPVLTGLGAFDDSCHMKQCRLKHCPRCKFIANREKWLQSCPWLDARYDMDSKMWGVGCRVCHQAQEKHGDMMQRFQSHRHHFARYEVRDLNMTLDRFKKHGESPAHRTAAQLSADPASGVGVGDGSGRAPTAAEWQAVLRHTEPSRFSLRVSEAGEAKKCQMMRFCLAEGHRQIQREALSKSLCMSLQQDARGNRFLVRFKSCDEQLRVTCGVLSLQKAVSTVDEPGAVRVRAATIQALQDFCTTPAPPNYGGLISDTRQPHFHAELFKKIVPKIEAIAADAAGDEQLAMRELAGIGGPNVVQLKDAMIQSFPSLKAWHCCLNLLIFHA